MSATAATFAAPLNPRRDRLLADIPTWSNFGRCLVLGISLLLVIPAPWAYTAYLKFIFQHIALPDGRRLSFNGRPAEVWFLLILLAILSWGGIFIALYIGTSGQTVTSIASFVVDFFILRWICANIRVQQGSMNLTFTGGFWPLMGWTVLVAISPLTVIGWAWAGKYAFRWICRNVSGDLAFDFVASGWSILWRTIVLSITCAFIIPIPWMLRWYKNWVVSEVVVSPSRP